jgi:hypothetical protein
MLSQPGIELNVNAYDNHELHLEEHRQAKKQPEFQKLKYMNPEQFVELEATFIMHEEQHKRLLAEQQRLMDARMAKVVQMQKGGRGGG